MSYIRKTVKGVSWIGALRAATRLVAFGKIAIVARLLTPAQFGLYGIASLVLSLLEIFTETGINVFFLQKEGNLKEYINTAWVISIFRGSIIAILIVISAPFISTFFNSPDSYYLIILISLVPFIRGFINPAEIRFLQEMNFQKEFFFRSVLFLFDASVAVVYALLTKDPASLVYGLIAGAFLEVVLSLIFIHPKPNLRIDVTKAKYIIQRGKWLTGYSVFKYIFENGDDIVVGKVLGPATLGIYQVAYKLAILPITEVADVFGKATLPIFVDIADNKKQLRKALLYTTAGVFVLLLPLVTVLWLFPEVIITILLGEQWLSAVSVLKVLAFYAIIRALVNPALTVFLALKKQEIVSLTSFVGTAILFSTIFPLLSFYGLVGVGIATIIASLTTVPIVMYYAWKLLK